MVTRYGMTEAFDMVALETVTNQYMGGDASLACAPETYMMGMENRSYLYLDDLSESQQKTILDVIDRLKKEFFNTIIRAAFAVLTTYRP